jgi:hypothetical protein
MSVTDVFNAVDRTTRKYTASLGSGVAEDIGQDALLRLCETGGDTSIEDAVSLVHQLAKKQRMNGEGRERSRLG